MTTPSREPGRIAAHDNRRDVRYVRRSASSVADLRVALAEAERRIDRLMVIRRRQLAAARSRRAAQ